MALVVRRYPWLPSDVFTLDMPTGAQVLGVELYNDKPKIIALINKSLEGTARQRFISVVADEPFPDGEWRYVGSLYNLHLFTA